MNGSTAMIAEPDALELLLQLLRIPGRSREETAVLGHIRETLLAAGVPTDAIAYDTAHERIPGGGQTGNLIVRLPGTIAGPRRLLMAHVDTVPICVGAEPVVEGDRIRSANPHTGLGGDDRAGAAVVLNTLCEVIRRGLPHPPLTGFFCVQEEVGLYGARYCSLDDLGRPELGFNWDGSEPQEVCVGATGDYALRIRIEGVASHAGVHPELGVSAAAIAAVAIASLQKRGWHGLILRNEERGTSNVGIIHGGEATNVVLPELTLRAEARSHNPAFRKRIVSEYRKAFERAAKSVRSADGKTGRVEFQADLQYEAFQLPLDAPPVQMAQSAIESLGLQPDVCVANGGLDANWMVAHGVPTVTLGCGQNGIHTVNEWLHLPGYFTACRIGLALATGGASPQP